MTCTTSTDTIQIIKGESFTPSMLVSDVDGPIDLTNYTITSYVNTSSGTKITDFIVVVADQITNKGQYSINSSTVDWPVGVVKWFIVYEENSVIRIVETPIRVTSNT